MSDYRRGLAFAAGKKAARAGKSEAANTRQRGTIYFDDWMDGYREALATQPAAGSEEKP